MGHTATELHSNRTLAQRKAALQGFKSGRFRVLVATDIAARGIDVRGIALVINFDLPDNSEDYVHRIGRTGRASSFGKAVSFATPDQRADLRQIERLLKKTLPILNVPTLPPRRTPPALPQAQHQHHARPSSRSGQDSSFSQGHRSRHQSGRSRHRSHDHRFSRSRH